MEISNNNISSVYKGINKTNAEPKDSKLQHAVNTNSIDSFERKPSLCLNIEVVFSFGRGFITGEQTVDDLVDEFKTRFENLLQINIQRGSTNGDDPTANQQILNKLFSDLKQAAIYTTLEASNDYATSEFGVDGTYYGAEYYYIANEIISALEDAYIQIAREKGLGDVAIPETQYDNYNDWWAQMNGGKVEFNPITAGAPPRDFEFFYERNPFNKEGLDQEYEYYHIVASDEDSGVTNLSCTLKLPRGLGLLRDNSMFSLLDLLARPDTGSPPGVQYDISRLLKNYPGSSLTECFNEFVTENFRSATDGKIIVGSSGGRVEREVPFSALGKLNYYNGSRLSSEVPNEVSAYLNNFTFRSILAPISDQYHQSHGTMNFII